ncbi:hypothetical protein [Roseovarius autotrophicus]|uniref:hypothetical protein n=1 Tax=Roseovarius autotrophicus TaxID=2824121 RepID=UPI0019E6A639|nr:hypothetical protein [Roseovarius autotrophicus]MBE0453125.1 hypothetical protein [Roseovarius sp.]
MAFGILFYLLVVALFAGFYVKRYFLPAAITFVPVVFGGYFIISVFIFSFGSFVPFTYYRVSDHASYAYAMGAFSAHFIAVGLAFMVFYRPRQSLSNAAVRLEEESGWRPMNFSLGLPGVMFCMLPVFFIILSGNVSDLVSRDGFILESAEHGWMRFEELSFFLSAALLPFIKVTTLRRLVLISLFIAFAALGSRSAVILLVIYASARFFLLRRIGSFKFMLIIIFSLYSLAITMILRVNDQGGLVSVFDAYINTHFFDVLQNLILGLNYILNLSFILIGEMFSTVEAGGDWFFYSVVPVPSFLYDRTFEYDAFMRFRKNIPYPGFGYAVLSLGLPIYLLIVFITSSVFLLIRSYLKAKDDLIDRIVCFCFFVFPLLILLQYNLRAGTRMIYVFAAIYFISVIVRRVKLFRSRSWV